MTSSLPRLLRTVPAAMACLALFGGTGCAVNPVTGERDLVFMSESQEIAMGKEYHPQILQQYGVYEDPELQKYVTRIGRRLAENSHRDDLIYRFTVLDSPQVNAFALPGGYVYITRGIMAYLNSEAELAGVLGHEIGHVTHRHSVQRHTASTVAGIFSTWVAVETGSRTYTDLSQILGGALVSGYSREQELEADARGAEYLARTGYDPEQMIEVVGVLKDQEVFAKEVARKEGREEPGYHGVFATHPRNDVRLQEVIRAADKYRAPVKRDEGHKDYLQAIQGMIYGDSPEQGVVRDGAFYHTKLDIGFNLPKDWYTQNLADRVVLAAPQQAAVIQLTLEDLNKRQTPEEYLKARLDTADAAESRALRIDGLEGYTLVTEARTSMGMRPARFTVIFKDNRAYLFLGTVKEAAEFSRYDPVFLETVQSFHDLSAAERAKARPYRIVPYKVRAGDNYEKLAARSPLRDHAEARLRLINGQYPDGTLKPGTLIKLVE